jgi:hypothetical protein
MMQLHSLDIYTGTETLATQNPAAKRIFKNLVKPGPSLRSLTMTSLARIDSMLLELISETLPGLEILELSCIERIRMECCWGCFEDSLSCIVHSPIGDYHVDCQSLVVRCLESFSLVTEGFTLTCE